MDGMVDSVAEKVSGHLINWLLSSIVAGLHWLAACVLHTIGWGGVVALAAGCILCLSMSACIVRFLHSPRGMGITAVTMLAGLLVMWWYWPEASPARVATPASIRQPVASPPVVAEQLPPVVKPQPKLEAVVMPPPAPIQRKGWLAALPYYPVIEQGNPFLALPPLPVVAMPHKPPVIVNRSSHHSGHLTPFRPTPHAAASHATVAASGGHPVVVPHARPHVQQVGPVSGVTVNSPGISRSGMPATIHQLNSHLMHNPAAVQSMMGIGGHAGMGMHPGGIGHTGGMGHMGSHGGHH